ncbi:hypothetical protein PCANC_09008 [Puccinia coronata f. sp. avenae]|uniref:Uncharacterized protein n=1 Tax=Puccinia coronata f. sp. avenae TaxID=200324 RepID=A0A2N5VHQ9_9BASI|nr:hypothetical protein PCANC_09008 [Puccinia coronata f. sp. avenae]
MADFKPLKQKLKKKKRRGNPNTDTILTPKEKTYLIPSQPIGEEHPQESTHELQQTIDQLLAEVSIPQIRTSSTATADGKAPSSMNRGTLRKLGQLVPNQVVQPSLVNVMGHRLLVPRNPLAAGGENGLVLTISRRTPFSVYLKRALAHLRQPHPGPLILRAMGCAISMAFSLAMAIQSHLRIATPARLLRSLSTGTVVVGDEVTPKSSDIAEPELIYQTRNQASVEINLTVKVP